MSSSRAILLTKPPQGSPTINASARKVRPRPKSRSRSRRRVSSKALKLQLQLNLKGSHRRCKCGGLLRITATATPLHRADATHARNRDLLAVRRSPRPEEIAATGASRVMDDGRQVAALKACYHRKLLLWRYRRRNRSPTRSLTHNLIP